MSTVVLARKYRPRRFDQLVGQPHVVQALGNALRQRRLHHAYLFTGTRGIGKTTISRILAKSLNCVGSDGRGDITDEPCGSCAACTAIDADRYVDYIELDAASNRSIDEVRDLIERAAYKPAVGRFKVFMIDEAHQLTKDAFNALLKTLEEPPEYLKFVLATTDPERMLPTVLSRCLQFNLRPMAPDIVQQHLETVLQAEGVAADAAALRLLGRAARGSMRDALSLADQAIAYGGGRIDASVVREMLGAVGPGHAASLLDAAADRDAPGLLARIDELREAGVSATSTLDAMTSLLQSAAVEQAVPGVLDDGDPDAAAARALASRMPADEMQLLYGMLLQGRGELAVTGDAYAALTMVVLRLFAFAPSRPRPADALAGAHGDDARRPAARPLRMPTAPMAVAVPARPAAGVGGAPSAPSRLAGPEPPAAVAPSPEVDRWASIVQALADDGQIAALVRELAVQAQPVSLDDRREPATWRLRVERETLRAPALAERLAEALSAHLGAPQRVEVEAGVPTDSIALRELAARRRRQLDAQAQAHADPLARALLDQFSGARIVAGSIKPV